MTQNLEAMLEDGIKDLEDFYADLKGVLEEKRDMVFSASELEVILASNEQRVWFPHCALSRCPRTRALVGILLTRRFVFVCTWRGCCFFFVYFYRQFACCSLALE